MAITDYGNLHHFIVRFPTQRMVLTRLTAFHVTCPHLGNIKNYFSSHTVKYYYFLLLQPLINKTGPLKNIGAVEAGALDNIGIIKYPH